MNLYFIRTETHMDGKEFHQDTFVMAATEKKAFRIALELNAFDIEQAVFDQMGTMISEEEGAILTYASNAQVICYPDHYELSNYITLYQDVEDNRDALINCIERSFKENRVVSKHQNAYKVSIKEDIIRAHVNAFVCLRVEQDELNFDLHLSFFSEYKLQICGASFMLLPPKHQEVEASIDDVLPLESIVDCQAMQSGLLKLLQQYLPQLFVINQIALHQKLIALKA